MALCVRPASANTPDLFSAQQVHVDVTDKSAAAAQNKALLLAPQLALKQLFALVVDPADLERLPEISAENAQNYVIAVSVDKERASRVRYIADITVELNKQAVKGYLAQYNVSYSLQAQMPPLLIPVLRQQDKSYLWEAENLWRSTLQNLPDSKKSLGFVTPVGDAKDGNLLTKDAAENGDIDALQDIAVKYGSKVVIVAIAALEEKPDGLELAVALNRSRGKQLYEPELFSISSVGQPTPLDVNALYARAVPQLIAALQIPPRKMESLPDSASPETDSTEGVVEGAELVADAAAGAIDTTPVNISKVLSIPLSGMQDWVRIRKRLERTEGINDVQVLSLQQQQASVRIAYTGTTENLNRLLSTYGGSPVASPKPNKETTPKRSAPLQPNEQSSSMNLRPTPEPSVFFEQ